MLLRRRQSNDFPPHHLTRVSALPSETENRWFQTVIAYFLGAFINIFFHFLVCLLTCWRRDESGCRVTWSSSWRHRSSGGWGGEGRGGGSVSGATSTSTWGRRAFFQDMEKQHGGVGFETSCLPADFTHQWRTRQPTRSASAIAYRGGLTGVQRWCNGWGIRLMN